ncbi:Aste57867_23851 [Aphanomyces stellatus]|uniref:Aste57867_23851 protein n=1 Tax=Aphanomyces stellatus TaxID=120398 RepID=A0A485LNU7_9STRA|nr:hypothetical protein As57867_023778 [Aphanomyces stellatus]VFU00494.1 Aste57867_23851 [Aphanomyces stellatus]
MLHSPSTTGGGSAIFLKKLFDMLQSTPPGLGGWCNGGSAFEIKSPKEFARVMLPQYFKHCKFTSFVRQLNFYGFQKLKQEVLLVEDEAAIDTDVVVFHHPHFLQHQPHLMSKIKRKTNHTESAGGSESAASDDVEELRQDVSDIKQSLASLETQLSHLTHIMAIAMRSRRSSPDPQDRCRDWKS